MYAKCLNMVSFISYFFILFIFSFYFFFPHRCWRDLQSPTHCRGGDKGREDCFWRWLPASKIKGGSDRQTHFSTGLQTVHDFCSVRVNPGFLVGRHHSPNDGLKHTDGADLKFGKIYFWTIIMIIWPFCWQIGTHGRESCPMLISYHQDRMLQNIGWIELKGFTHPPLSAEISKGNKNFSNGSLSVEE